MNTYRILTSLFSVALAISLTTPQYNAAEIPYHKPTTAGVSDEEKSALADLESDDAFANITKKIERLSAGRANAYVEYTERRARSFYGLTRLEFPNVSQISDKVAGELAKHRGWLFLNGLTSLSDEAAQALSQHRGRLYLNGLKTLSDKAAKSLAQHGLVPRRENGRIVESGGLHLDGLTTLSDEAARALAQTNGDLWLRGLTTLSDEAAAVLRRGRNVRLPDKFEGKKDESAESTQFVPAVEIKEIVVDGEDIRRQVSSADTPRSLPGEGFNGPGFRLLKDENQRVVAAHYHGEAGIDFLLRHGKAQSSDFSAPTQLHVYPHLESLTYPYGFRLTTEDVGYIATLQNLKEIELGFVGVSSEYVTIEGDLSKLGRLKRLERVHLCKEELTDQDLKFITALPRIKHLEFNANTNGRGEEGPRCTDRCADYLSQATTLEAVWVHDATNFTDRFVSKMTEGLVNLEYFQMSSPELTDESLRLLAERCNKLNWLDIDSDRFTDEGVQHLKKAENLRKLWLRSSSLNDKSVSHIKGLSQLQHLELTVPSVDDDDVLVLASFRELEILALRRPALTDQQFAMFRNHPRLKSAFINGRQLSKDEVVKVMETLPNLRHLQIGGNESLQREVDQALARKQASR